MFQLLLICALFVSISSFECTGNGYFRDPADCAKMIRCSNGKITHRFSCSEGKVFNDLTKSCDEPKYVNCDHSVTATIDNTSPSSVITNEPSFAFSNTPTPSTPPSSSLSPIYPKSLSTTDYTTTDSAIESKTTENPIFMEKFLTTKNLILINESFVEYEDAKKLVHLNESFVVYDEKSFHTLNESFVVYENKVDEEEDTITSTQISIEATTEPITESNTESNTEPNTELNSEANTETNTEPNTEITTEPTTDSVPELLITSTTDSPTEYITTELTDLNTTPAIIPTPIANIELPVLESILQNDTTTQTDTIVTESTLLSETNATTYSNCIIEETQVGLRMISSNYSTNETSKLLDLYKVICYFTNWARYRPEYGKFTVNNINPFLCTHIIYSFAVLDNQTLTLKSLDECTDIDNRFYEQITKLKLKNPRLKVLIALGGWVDSEGDKYSRLVSNQTIRSQFIENTIQFIIRHNFDGLDLDWEYPKCWQGNCAQGPHSDKTNFAKLIRELRIAFNKQTKPLLLSAAVAATKLIIDYSYEINSLSMNLDFINIMSYDYYTIGSTFASHHSPLYSHPNVNDLSHLIFNANFTVNYWIKKGIPSHKLMLGIPFYGRTFRLLDPEINDFGSLVNGTGDEGYYTKEKGFLSYYEICTNIVNNGWAKRTDTYVYNGRPVMTGPYAYYRDQWVGYDDREHIIQKTKFIKEMGLGGAMIWAIDLDDFNGICCKTKSPLLKTVNQELREYSLKNDLNFFCP